MKILYAIQATGNGHLARAREIIPALTERAEVDILISGIQGDLDLPYPVSYQRHGLSFIFGKNGRVDLAATINALRPIRLWKDIKSCPVEKYDLVIHDFEPIAAHACLRKRVRNISLSHQAAFFYRETPRPNRKNPYAEWVIRNYAPSDCHLGLHFNAYHPSIFTPVIRKNIRDLEPEQHEHVVVYLPAYCHHYLSTIFQKIPDVQWKIFSKHCHKKEQEKNIEIYPISHEDWLEALRTCHAAVVGAGFEGPSEILFLGKKLLAIPMKNQYEQQCNAAALRNIGVKILNKIGNDKISELKEWINTDDAKMIPFPDNTDQIVDEILKVS